MLVSNGHLSPQRRRTKPPPSPFLHPSLPLSASRYQAALIPLAIDSESATVGWVGTWLIPLPPTPHRLLAPSLSSFATDSPTLCQRGYREALGAPQRRTANVFTRLVTHSHLGLAPHTFSLHRHPPRGRLRGGVTAFYTTERVMCASVHNFGDFFPGTTGTQDDGAGKGKGIPVRPVVSGVMARVTDVFRPTAIVLQCAPTHSQAITSAASISRSQDTQIQSPARLPRRRRRRRLHDQARRDWLENDVSEELPWCQYSEAHAVRDRALGQLHELRGTH
ncbi:hypothetical protein C8F01DRAFT_1262428 [Mycena amicta]|nr:hypothetical protein C8F01DRAFT_1262428 [Mycena amicta]